MPERLTELPSWQSHIPFAFWCVEASRPGVLVELGTLRGDSYCAFCQAVVRLSLPPAPVPRVPGRASGVTALIDRLLEFAPADVPQQVFWPAFDRELDWCRSRDEHLREQLGIASDEHVVAYTGNVHLANRREVASLYLAVALLRRRGARLRLVRTGTYYAPPYAPELAEVMRSSVVELGYRPRGELPRILSLAHALVQPGGPDPFNDFRFPSKLLASGKPVMLPRSNIGRHLEDGWECVLLELGNAVELARKLGALLADESPRRAAARTRGTAADPRRCDADRGRRGPRGRPSRGRDPSRRHA